MTELTLAIWFLLKEMLTLVSAFLPSALFPRQFPFRPESMLPTYDSAP